MKAQALFRLLKHTILALLVLMASSATAYAKDCQVYRIYNPTSGEHLYTADCAEVFHLISSRNWVDEGVGWSCSDSGAPVYRLYHPQLCDHLYTSDKNEVSVLTGQGGWIMDNNGQPLFNSNGTIPVYRMRRGSTGRHHLTLDHNECEVISGQGWSQEGVAFYASALGNPTPVTSHDSGSCPYGADCPAHHDSSHCVYGVDCPAHHDSGHCLYGSNCPVHGGSHHSEHASHHQGGHH